MNTTDQTLASAPITAVPSKIWRPIRPTTPINPTDDRINQLQGKIAAVTTSVSELNSSLTQSTSSNPSTPANAPGQVTGVVASVTTANIGGNLVAVIDVNFTPGLNFASAQLWAIGYNGNSSPQLLSQGFSSPLEYAAQITNEIVTLKVVAVNSGGVSADFTSAPSTTVTLNGASTAPPAPSINQSLVALSGSTGWQFSFNVINGLLADVISGYWVYRSSTHTTPTSPSGRFQWIPQPPSTVPYTFQDVTGATYYYWVSAVSTSGLESALTDATATDISVFYYPTVTTGSFPNPERAYDGNTASSSSVSLASPSGGPGSTSASEIWSDFGPGPTGVTITDVTLQVLSYATNVNQAISLLEYDMGDGTGWHTLYFLSTPDVDSTDQAYQYYTASLPLTQDLTLLRVQAVATAISTHVGLGSYDQGQVAQYIYEARVSVTYH